MLDSARFKKQKHQCELAAKLAEYLEYNAPEDSYDFPLPDLLYFEDELILSELRDEVRWKALESQFIAQKGMIVEPDSEPESSELRQAQNPLCRTVEPEEREEKPLIRLRIVNPWRMAFQWLLFLAIISSFSAYKIGEIQGQQTQVIGANYETQD